MTRRVFLHLAGALSLCSRHLIGDVRAEVSGLKGPLLTAPIEMGEGWTSFYPEAAARVVSRMREVCLSGVRLLSDRQPDKIRVDNHADGPPAIWLHDDQPRTAWIIVDIGPRDWCKLAYQFGHELGHVLCNSWEASAKPRPPSQWLEEAMVEAFSVRGLALLARSWEMAPPFAGDAGFAAAIREYRGNLIAKYRKETEQKFAFDVPAWFRAYRSSLESAGGAVEGLAVLKILAVLEGDADCVEDLAAVNRWPSRSGVPIEEYLTLWEKSCQDVKASGRLPAQLRSLFRVS